MFNPQSYAYSIELTLRGHNYAEIHSADSIRKDPISFLENILDVLSEKSEENQKRIFAFDDKYEKYKGKKLDEWTENEAAQFVKDVRILFNNVS